MADKTTFLLSREYEAFTDEMSDEAAGKLFKAILRHENGGEVTDIPVEAKSAWAFIRNRLDSNAEAYKAKCEQNARNRASVNDRRRPLTTVDGRGSDKDKDNDKDNDNDKDKDSNREKRKSAFIPPTVAEVQDYCRERGNSVDAHQFVNFYSAKNWFVGRNKMVDWKAAVRTWERRDNHGGSNSRRNVFDAWDEA